MSRRTSLISWFAATLLVGACSAAPFADSDLPSCGEGKDIYLPPKQGPDASEMDSLDAIACFQTALDEGKEITLSFVLLGTEGQEFDATVRSHSDGTVDFFRELEGLGKMFRFACTNFRFEPPGIPEVAGCSDRPPEG